MRHIPRNVTVETNLQCSVDLLSRQPRAPCPYPPDLKQEYEVQTEMELKTCSKICDIEKPQRNSKSRHHEHSEMPSSTIRSGNSLPSELLVMNVHCGQQLEKDVLARLFVHGKDSRAGSTSNLRNWHRDVNIDEESQSTSENLLCLRAFFVSARTSP